MRIRYVIVLLVGTWLLCKSSPSIHFPSIHFPAIGTPQRFIDTKQECEAEAGVWTSYPKGWRQFCVVPAKDKHVCRSAGGKWMPVPLARPPSKHCQIFPSPAALLRQCVEINRGKTHPPEVGDPCDLSAEALECLSTGGGWSRDGLGQQLMCIRAAEDAYEPCRGDSDCTYGCESEHSLPPGTEVIGRCQSTSSPFGCRTIVESGRVVGTECVD